MLAFSSHPRISLFNPPPVSSFHRRRKKANFRKLAQASVKHLNAKHGQLMRDLKARQATQQAVARRMSRAVGKFWKKIDQVHGHSLSEGGGVRGGGGWMRCEWMGGWRWWVDGATCGVVLSIRSFSFTHIHTLTRVSLYSSPHTHTVPHTSSGSCYCCSPRWYSTSIARRSIRQGAR